MKLRQSLERAVLLRGLLIPRKGCCLVPFDAFAQLISHAKNQFGGNVSLLRVPLRVEERRVRLNDIAMFATFLGYRDTGTPGQNWSRLGTG